LTKELPHTQFGDEDVPRDKEERSESSSTPVEEKIGPSSIHTEERKKPLPASAEEGKVPSTPAKSSESEEVCMPDRCMRVCDVMYAS
jgi:hypothetical protein